MATDHRRHSMAENHYRHLFIMAALSFLAMYILMYAMVNSLEDVYMNVNQVYMAGLMTAPMIIIELVVMRAMYDNGSLNVLLIGGSVVVGIALFLSIQQQTLTNGAPPRLTSELAQQANMLVTMWDAVTNVRTCPASSVMTGRSTTRRDDPPKTFAASATTYGHVFRL